MKTSGFLIRKWGFSLVFLAAVAVLAVLLGSRLPGAFVPSEDQGYLFAALQLPDAASLERNSLACAKVEDILKKTPGVEGVTSIIGFSLLTQTQATYSSFFFVTLKDWDQRKKPEEQYEAIQGSVAKSLSGIKEGIAFFFPPPAIQGVGTSGGVTFILEDRSNSADPNFLAANMGKFLEAASKRKEFVAIIPSYLPAVPQLYVDVDRQKVLQQQVDLGEVYQTLQTFMGGYLVNYFNRFGRQWQTYVEAEGSYRTNVENIGQFYVKSANGGLVPLSAVATVKRITGPEFTLRFNQYQAAQLNVTAAPGVSSGQAMAALEEVFHQSMPSQMGFDYQGMSFQEKKAAEGTSAAAVFGFSLLFVFLILAAQYESWSLPFSVLLSTPIAIFGGYLALTLRGLENDVYTQVGVVMLIGLSAKNAILIVEFARSEYEKGKDIVDSALTAAQLRFRPILMTAFAFILGCVPLWTATGSGAASRRVLGTSVIGGMLAATLIAIFIVPVTFSVVEWIIRRFSKSRPPVASPKIAPQEKGSEA